ncbi:hypothetical protein AVEN_136925-1 [Araneus ventricosus]|uniref:Uncharacterized protein n=1 Tax=Araneus ventricosus TaxID=182803 RepID=A0A4Y2BJK8_ARAVE|nr:hypothetical protein AVEN_136925-1 [Araneus ventricosus]
MRMGSHKKHDMKYFCCLRSDYGYGKMEFQGLSDSCEVVQSPETKRRDETATTRDYLKKELPHRWIGRAGLDDGPLLPWPPRSPDLTSCDFFLWGYVKNKVYIPPMPTTLQALQERITASVTDIDRNMY